MLKRMLNLPVFFFLFSLIRVDKKNNELLMLKVICLHCLINRAMVID